MQKLLVRGVLTVAGIAAIALVVHWVGADSVRAALAKIWIWVPLLLLLEGTRIPLELWATVRLLDARAAAVPKALLWRAHFVFYGCSIALPGGRPLAEVSKAAILAPHLGAARAAALAASGQAMSFVADALIAICGTLAAWQLTGPSRLTAAAGLLAIGGSLLTVLIVAAARGSALSRAFARFPSLARFAQGLRAAALEQTMVVPQVIGILLLARCFQITLFGVMFHAIGGQGSLAHALVGQVLMMMGSVLGDAVPAQLGTTDAAFAAAAGTLGTSAANMASIALAFHAVQLTWVATAIVVALLWRSAPRLRADAA